jgi:hypothetical protein
MFEKLPSGAQYEKQVEMYEGGLGFTRLLPSTLRWEYSWPS